jgi:hypothetical protein
MECPKNGCVKDDKERSRELRGDAFARSLQAQFG